MQADTQALGVTRALAVPLGIAIVGLAGWLWSGFAPREVLADEGDNCVGGQVHQGYPTHNGPTWWLVLVPTGCTRMKVEMWGGGGSGSNTTPPYLFRNQGVGGGGGHVLAIFNVAPGQEFHSLPGRAFGPTNATAIWRGDPFDGGIPLAVAGMGGGAASTTHPTYPGLVLGHGGPGGSYRAAGATTWSPSGSGSRQVLYGGGTGTASAPGAAGVNPSNSSCNGGIGRGPWWLGGGIWQSGVIDINTLFASLGCGAGSNSTTGYGGGGYYSGGTGARTPPPTLAAPSEFGAAGGGGGSWVNDEFVDRAAMGFASSAGPTFREPGGLSNPDHAGAGWGSKSGTQSNLIDFLGRGGRVVITFGEDIQLEENILPPGWSDVYRHDLCSIGWSASQYPPPPGHGCDSASVQCRVAFDVAGTDVGVCGMTCTNAARVYNYTWRNVCN